MEDAFLSLNSGNLETLVLGLFKNFHTMETKEGLSCILASCEPMKLTESG